MRSILMCVNALIRSCTSFHSTLPWHTTRLFNGRLDYFATVNQSFVCQWRYNPSVAIPLHAPIYSAFAHIRTLKQTNERTHNGTPTHTLSPTGIQFTCQSVNSILKCKVQFQHIRFGFVQKLIHRIK